MEQEEYRKEQITWSYIEFIDNQDVLDLIEKVISYFLLYLMYYFLHCTRSYLSILNIIMLLQKPIGVIALLDEAWYE